MTRLLVLALVALALLLLAVGAWTLQGVHWALRLPTRRRPGMAAA
ncbi:MAG TPA: hypothetical protein VEY87_00455 [Gaiellaceae bacterium]|jgi:hypothetical protein|nr:hypothetical protein [Gaiellaceae bacterium]